MGSLNIRPAPGESRPRQVQRSPQRRPPPDSSRTPIDRRVPSPAEKTPIGSPEKLRSATSPERKDAKKDGRPSGRDGRESRSRRSRGPFQPRADVIDKLDQSIFGLAGEGET